MAYIVDDFFGEVIREAERLRKARGAVVDEKYSPDQPRDDQGRFSSGGGGGSGYREASTITEAEEVAQQWVKDGGAVDYGQIDVGLANEANKELAAVYDEFPGLSKLTGITAKPFEDAMADADAAYISNRAGTVGHLMLNSTNLTSPEALSRHLKEASKTDELLRSLDADDLETLSAGVGQDYVEYMKYERPLVGTGVDQMVRHEMGHHFDAAIMSSAPNRDERAELVMRMDQYKYGISHYAGSQSDEYIAESFAAYKFGVGSIDPRMRDFFDQHRSK